MSLEYSVDDISNLSEEVQGLYAKQEDGNYQLDVSGVTDESKLTEFRSNNRKLFSELSEMKEKFGGIDLEKYQEMLTREQKIKDKKLLDAGKVDELVENRVSAMREELEKANSDLTNQNGKLHSQLETLIIDNNARDAAIQAGVAPTAVDDVLFRVRGTYKLQEGKAVPYDAQGNVIYGPDGITPVEINNWVKGLHKTAPHLFAKSSGSDAPGSGSSGSNEVSRQEFDAMGHAARAKFFKSGGKIAA